MVDVAYGLDGHCKEVGIYSKCKMKHETLEQGSICYAVHFETTLWPQVENIA